MGTVLLTTDQESQLRCCRALIHRRLNTERGALGQVGVLAFVLSRIDVSLLEWRLLVLLVDIHHG